MTTPNVIEWIWLVISALGMAAAVINYIEARAARRAAMVQPNYRHEARMILADGAVWRQKIRVACFGWWIVLGVAWGFFELPDIPRIVGTFGLLGTALAFSMIGAQEIGERRRLHVILQMEIDLAGRPPGSSAPGIDGEASSLY